MKAAEKAVASDNNKLLINNVFFTIMILRPLLPWIVIFFYKK